MLFLRKEPIHVISPMHIYSISYTCLLETVAIKSDASFSAHTHSSKWRSRQGSNVLVYSLVYLEQWEGVICSSRSSSLYAIRKVVYTLLKKDIEKRRKKQIYSLPPFRFSNSRLRPFYLLARATRLRENSF